MVKLGVQMALDKRDKAKIEMIKDNKNVKRNLLDQKQIKKNLRKYNRSIQIQNISSEKLMSLQELISQKQMSRKIKAEH